MENHHRELLRSLSARLKDRHTAVGVTHDTCLCVLERSSQAQIKHLKVSLYQTMLSLAVDEYHRSRMRRAGPLKILDDREGLASPLPQTVVDQGQRLSNLQHILTELSAICRSSFLLRKLDGLSHSQIVEHPNVPHSPVERHIVDTMERCRVHMREQETD